ncbi:hypothetical protein ABL78_6043 [Leptomonas seymouri]|uniref:CCZ1/INTU/HSP4 first Longin domain-containing protein n=1 Tax=Leptomonas seymouri TaxID=5684 RepID=A0A0N1HW11_LEPSE|nr:hypothetical protein ABL78_6043 [Leptomonas seymouri]|eukprot:KPI84918.1 hypothetical protein ABL78_6043 [Leptomonas seymouri]
MNQVGFCIAMSSLAGRFGIRLSNRQTICKQRSSVCLCSPVVDLWASAHVRGGYSEAETTHLLLQLSFALFELLYSRALLYMLTEPPRDMEAIVTPSDERSSTATSHVHGVGEGQAVLRSFFTKCANFISDVLAAQRLALAGAGAMSFHPSPSMTPTQWAQYLCGEATLGFPLNYANARELPRRQLGGVEDTVHRLLWSRAWAKAHSLHEPDELPCCCVFCLPSLHVLMSDRRLSSKVLQTLKYYLMLYAPIACSSFLCYLPGEDGPCDVAVWQEGNTVVVLMEAQVRQAGLQPAHTVSIDGLCAAANPSPTPSSPSSSLLQCASAIGIEVHQQLVQAAAGLATQIERDEYWLSTCDAARHKAQYAAAPALLSVASDTSPNALVIWLRFVNGVVEGTSLARVWPGFIEHIRTIIHSTKLITASSPSADAACECWTRWSSIWIYLHFGVTAVTVLAWRSPVNHAQLFHDAKRAFLLQS